MTRDSKEVNAPTGYENVDDESLANYAAATIDGILQDGVAIEERKSTLLAIFNEAVRRIQK